MREAHDIRRKVTSFAQIERIYEYICIYIFFYEALRKPLVQPTVPIIHVINPAVALSFFLHGFSFTPTVQQTSIIVIRLPMLSILTFYVVGQCKTFPISKSKLRNPLAKVQTIPAVYGMQRKKEETILRLGLGSGVDEILHLKSRNIIRSDVFIRLVYFSRRLITHQMIIKTRQKKFTRQACFIRGFYLVDK